MIVGGFDRRKRPYVACRLYIPRLRVSGEIAFLLDTGSDRTSLHPLDARSINVPSDWLSGAIETRGVGGTSPYFREYAQMAFDDGDRVQVYGIDIRIAQPNENNAGLPSLLGRDVFNRWRIVYDPTNDILDSSFTAGPA